MTWHRALLVVMLLSAAFGCSRQASVGEGISARQTPRSIPSIRVELHRESPHLIRVQWYLRNDSAGPIWVPVTWDSSRVWEQPIAFLIPSGEIVFVFGSFHKRDVRELKEWAEWAEIGADFKRIEPGNRIRGKVLLPLPYDVGNVPPELGNPFEGRKTEGAILALKEVTLRDASGVYLAAEYWLRDPNDSDRASPIHLRRVSKMDMGHELVREAMADALIRGTSRPDAFAHARRVVTSNRVAARIPLNEPVTFCESIRGVWPPDE